MASEGHCRNIRNPAFRQIGVAANTKATQAFGGRGGAAAGSLISGVFSGGRFLAVAAGSPSNVRVWVGNEPRQMTHVGGGVYQAPGAGVGSCTQYFFEVDATRQSVFPAGSAGFLQANCDSLFNGADKPEPTIPAASSAAGNGTATRTAGVTAIQSGPLPTAAMDDATVSDAKNSEDNKDSNAAPGVSIGTGIAAFSVLLVGGGLLLRKARQRGYGFSDVFPQGSQQPADHVREQFETYLGSTRNGTTSGPRSQRSGTPGRLPIPAWLAGKMRPASVAEPQGVPARALEAARTGGSLVKEQQKRSKHQAKSSLDSFYTSLQVHTVDDRQQKRVRAVVHLDIAHLTAVARTSGSRVEQRPASFIVESGDGADDGQTMMHDIVARTNLPQVTVESRGVSSHQDALRRPTTIPTSGGSRRPSQNGVTRINTAAVGRRRGSELSTSSIPDSSKQLLSGKAMTPHSEEQ